MRNINSLKGNEFKEIYEKGKSYANKNLVMYILKKELPDIRLGISVSKKVGNSIVRHKITRLIRESYRLNKSLINDSGYSIVVVARSAAKQKNFFEIEGSFKHLCRMHGIIEKNEKSQ